MFTFKVQDKDPLFYIDNRPVYATFTKKEVDRIRPFRNTSKYLGSNEFLERYSLSKREGQELKKALQSDIIPDNSLKGKFFHIRRDLNQRLYTEIDLRGTEHTINWRYPTKIKEWPETKILIGSSNSGKTHLVVTEITEALKRPKKRKFVYVSPELNVDTTLKKIINTKRWDKYFQGIDVSDDAFLESEKGLEEWWKEIETTLVNQPQGTSIVLDDAPDSQVHKYLQKFLVKYLRTGRHKKVGITSIQHNVRGGKWTSQSFSSVKWVVLFPRGSGKGKIVEWLYESLGVGRKKARVLVNIFGETGRFMYIHQWSPTVVFGPKYAVWV